MRGRVRPAFATAFLAAGLITGLVPHARAQSGMQQLPGVGVYVMADGIEESARKAVETDMAAEVESQLRVQGVTVRKGQALTDPRAIWLQVEVSLAREPKEWTALSVRASLRQGCRLSRPPNTELMASTWEASSTAIVRVNDWRDGLRDAIHSVSEAFLSEYRSQNPMRK